MSKTTQINGHRVEIGYCLEGTGKRVYIDGEDKTEYVNRLLRSDTDGIVHGTSFVIDALERASIQSTTD